MQTFEWRKGIKRADRANGTDVFVTGEIWEAEEGGSERQEWESLFEQGKAPTPFTQEEKKQWFEEIKGKVSLASDAFFPFPDNVWRARRSGVGHFAAPGGSVMDAKIIETADESDAIYIMTDLRCVASPCILLTRARRQLTVGFHASVSSPTKLIRRSGSTQRAGVFTSSTTR